MPGPHTPDNGRDRGLAFGIIAFFAIIIIAALLYSLMDPALAEVFSMVSSQTGDQTAQDAIDTRKQIWGLLPLFAVFAGLLMLIARSVFEQDVP